MSILVNRQTRVLIQGITGKAGWFHTKLSLDYGTPVVGGVTPGKGGSVAQEDHYQVPVFNSVKEAMQRTEANASVIFVPARFAADAILEAGEAGIQLIVVITEGIPINDMIEVKARLQKLKNVLLIGPNCPGVTTLEEARLGIQPITVGKRGKIGIVSRSGTLTYEALDQVSRVGLGVTTCVGIGGDPVHGADFVQILQLFQEDPETLGLVMIGEIGGSDEEQAADWARHNLKKPMVSFIAGISAPPGRRMGHAGAIISAGKGSAQQKIEALRKAGIVVVENPSEIGQSMKLALENF